MPPRGFSSALAQPNACTRRRSALALAVAGAIAGSTLALGAPAAGASASGGSTYVARPEVKRIQCVRSCASKRRVRAGQSQIRITGHSLSRVRTIVFHGGPGRSDDVKVRVLRRSSRAVRAPVPFEAVSGRISVRVSRKVRSRRSRRRLRILPAAAPLPNPKLSLARGPRDPGAPRVETGTSGTRYFYGSRHGIAFSYRLRHAAPARVTVAVIRASDGTVVRSWGARTVAPGKVETVRWRGTRGGRVERSGRYLFRVTARTGGATARNATTHNARRDAFNLYGHIFPIRGRHDYGGAGARFGAGRGGRSHQGHDVFAACGTKMVAARGGRVKAKAYQGAAGHYIVIDGARTGVDYAYMHLTGPSPFDEGDRVRTGQRIGSVGETGNAQGCHLHFELWRGPGWYTGGRPFNPLPRLKAWDRVS